MAVKRAFVLLAAIAAIVLLVPGVALANYAVHGSYSMSTDACAGCHRAHTAASPIQWHDTTGAEGGSALLLGTAASIDEFCYTCHGSGMLGADTNVVDGIFEANDGYDTAGDRVYNSAGESLNGGGFDPAVFPTQHYPNNTTWVAYGGGTTGRDGVISVGGTQVVIGCTVCHDVHGSSNYRLLKDVVNGVTVGGYDGSVDPQNPTPQPFVISSEEGYPSGGWLLHEPGASQVTTYKPDYTTPRYAKAPSEETSKGISAWCAACHTQYVNTTSVYDAADGFGLVTRHRHPVNVPLTNFATKLHPGSLIVTDNPLPLAHDSSEATSWANEDTDWLDCLTCHVAHGSSAVMTGYANIANAQDPQPDSGSGSVPPDDGNALLRGNNRYVCEVCHNK